MTTNDKQSSPTSATSRLIVNCLPLTPEQQRGFIEAADGVRQEFVADAGNHGNSTWRAHVPEPLRARATAVIGNIPPATIGQYPLLEWLQTWSAGVDQYLAPGVLTSHTMVTNASGAYGQSVSEHMFAMMWALMKRLPTYAIQQTRHSWSDAGDALSPVGGTAVVIGTGDIGSHFAQLAHGVGMHTIGIRRHAGHPAAGIDDMRGFADLDAVLPQAHVVALSVPSTPETHHLIDRSRLGLLASDAIVLNVGRGDALDTDALSQVLHEGMIWGAGLDVTDPEPLPGDHPLWAEPRCLITPHVAGGDHLNGTSEAIIAIARENVRRYAAGEPLHNRRH